MQLTGIIPWYGAKRNDKIRSKIITELGSNHRGFCELMCGSMAVFLAKKPVAMEIVNDMHGDLINLARVLASKRYVELYERTERTLIHADIYLECRDWWAERTETIVAPSVDHIEDIHIEMAYRYVVSQWMGINGLSGTGRTDSQMARRYTVGGGHAATRWNGVPLSIPPWHKRLKNATIDRCDGFELASKLEDDGTWAIYVDPPYYRKGTTYVHDFVIDKTTGKNQHVELRDLLSSKKNTRIVISYYDEQEIRELYKDWNIIKCYQTKALVNQGMRDSKPGDDFVAPEILIVNGDSYSSEASLF